MKKLVGLIFIILFISLLGTNIRADELKIDGMDYQEEIAKTPATQSVTQPLIKPYLINIDNKKIVAHLFINESGRSMISTKELTKVFSCTADWVDSNQVYISHKLGNWHFAINNFTFFNETKIKNMDISPTIIANDMYIPLRYLAEELGYVITYCQESDEFLLSSAEDLEELSCEKLHIKVDDFPAANLPTWGSLAGMHLDEPLIGAYYTTLLDRSFNRTNNVILAAQAINNTILQPDEVFSFNELVGRRTTAKGYRPAPIFSGKQVVNGIGGGICQVSSTLYNTALEANLPIKERQPHSLRVAYVAPGRDASVAWAAVDFRFQNSNPYPIKLVVQVMDKYVVTGIVPIKD